MKICSKCKSDVITTNSHVILKVVLCLLILFFIPYIGLFLFWLPLLIPGSYQCSKCEGSDILELDWREFEEMKDEIRSTHPEPPVQAHFKHDSPYTFDIEEDN